MTQGPLTKIGRFLLVYGILSMILYFFGMNLIIFFWIDLFGPTIGWIIRIVMVLVGLTLTLISKYYVKS